MLCGIHILRYLAAEAPQSRIWMSGGQRRRDNQQGWICHEITTLNKLIPGREFIMQPSPL